MTKKIMINIAWQGPFTQQEVTDLTNDTDYGVYQLYGRHPIYGMLPGTLLYIGKAQKQTFATRIGQHTLEPFVGATAEIFVGRLAGEHQPNNAEWDRYIAEVEKLLIYAHAPAWNSHFIDNYGEDIRNLHILNWGNYGQLLPEVSKDRYEYPHNNLPDNLSNLLSKLVKARFPYARLSIRISACANSMTNTGDNHGR